MAQNEKPRAPAPWKCYFMGPELVTVFTDLLRAVARPAVTIIFAAVIAQAVVQGTPVPQWFLALAIPCITWWFAERTITHVKKKKED